MHKSRSAIDAQQKAYYESNPSVMLGRVLIALVVFWIIGIAVAIIRFL